MRTGLVFLLGMLILPLVSGCGAAEDPQLKAFRTALTVSSEPTGAVSIETARKNIETETSLVLIGKVGNKEAPRWWSEKEASIVVSEGFPDSHYNVGPDHDPSTCPFCKSKWKMEDSLAMIRCVDESGQIIPWDARKLLDIEEGDFIVVRGTGRLDDNGLLVIDAREVFRRPS